LRSLNPEGSLCQNLNFEFTSFSLYIDLLIEDQVIVEVKATEKITRFMKYKFSYIRPLLKPHLIVKIALFVNFASDFVLDLQKSPQFTEILILR